MVDSIFRTRSLGVPATGLPDQYADGKAAKVWELYIGCKQTRTSKYLEWISGVLRSHGYHTVLDVACGTGVDSCMLLDAGFAVTSTDASDKMLKYALQERWNRRKEDAYDKWVIDEANWLSLVEDFEDIQHPSEGFDAVICLGNSFAHLPDFDGSLNSQRTALSNFRDMIKPGGMLIIDHRNYDAILDKGMAPAKNIYYNSDHIVDIKTSNLYVNGTAMMVTLDYKLDISKAFKKQQFLKSEPDFKDDKRFQTFRLSYYPHRLNPFDELLVDVFGEKAQQEVYGDFMPYNEIEVPAYYIHTVKKPAT